MLPGDPRFTRHSVVRIPATHPSPFLAGRCGKVQARHWTYVGTKLYATVKIGVSGPEVLIDPDDLIWLPPDANAGMGYILSNPDQPEANTWRPLYQDVKHQTFLLMQLLKSLHLPVGLFMDRVWVSSDLGFVLDGDKEKTGALGPQALVELEKHYMGLMGACERLAVEEERLLR